jgi:hypothetical protein
MKSNIPCNNITESIRIEIDSEDRLRNYELGKQRCGLAIGGDSPLINNLLRRPISEILELDINAFCREESDNINRFLSLKHLLALKMTLETLIGKEAGGPTDFCRIIEINYDKDRLIIEAEIDVNIATNKIRLCDACISGCVVKNSLRAN